MGTLDPYTDPLLWSTIGLPPPRGLDLSLFADWFKTPIVSSNANKNILFSCYTFTFWIIWSGKVGFQQLFVLFMGLDKCSLPIPNPTIHVPLALISKAYSLPWYWGRREWLPCLPGLDRRLTALWPTEWHTYHISLHSRLASRLDSAGNPGRKEGIIGSPFAQLPPLTLRSHSVSLHWEWKFWANSEAFSIPSGCSRRSPQWRHASVRGNGNWKLVAASPNSSAQSDEEIKKNYSN